LDILSKKFGRKKSTPAGMIATLTCPAEETMLLLKKSTKVGYLEQWFKLKTNTGNAPLTPPT